MLHLDTLLQISMYAALLIVFWDRTSYFFSSFFLKINGTMKDKYKSEWNFVHLSVSRIFPVILFFHCSFTYIEHDQWLSRRLSYMTSKNHDDIPHERFSRFPDMLHQDLEFIGCANLRHDIGAGSLEFIVLTIKGLIIDITMGDTRMSHWLKMKEKEISKLNEIKQINNPSEK